MKKLFEAKYGDESSTRDGGFVFQAIISHEVKWEIRDGETIIDPKNINCMLHQVDLFPDIKFNAGSATSTYVILSEVNILKRKFELASEALKKRINLEYGKEIESLKTAGETTQGKRELNEKYFKNTYFEATLSTSRVVLREVSSSGLDRGNATVTLKLSTGMVDTLDNQQINSWNSFVIKVDGAAQLQLTNQGEDPISSIIEHDAIENTNDVIFRTIVPSLVLSFKGDQVGIDTFTRRSARVATVTKTDYKDLFNVTTIKQQQSESGDVENK